MAESLFLFGAGQLADWEGGDSIEVEVNSALNLPINSQTTTHVLVLLTQYPAFNLNVNWYGPTKFMGNATHVPGRTLEVMDGAAAGESMVITQSVHSAATSEILFVAAEGVTMNTLPSNGDTIRIHPSGQTTNAYPNGMSDGTDWKNVLVWNNDSTDVKQYRIKGAVPTTSDIADGIATPGNDRLIVQELVFQTSLGYRLGNLTHSLTHQYLRYHNTIYPYFTSVTGTPKISGTRFDDAMGLVEFRILVDGNVYENMTGVNPRSSLTVPAETIHQTEFPRAYLGQAQRMASPFPYSDFVGFSREHTYTNFLSRPISVGPNGTFAVQARLTEANVVVEYDCWARGLYHK